MLSPPKTMVISEMRGDGKEVRDLTLSAVISKVTDGHNAGDCLNLAFELSIHLHGSKSLKV